MRSSTKNKLFYTVLMGEADTNTWPFCYDGDGKQVSHLITQGAASSQSQYFMSGGYEVTSDMVAGACSVQGVIPILYPEDNNR